ncbi:MAG: hypothetical protein IJO14_07740 [Clostridia bacterium]|nr:hypothetical protein [Clostridia bacterium]
MTDLLFALLKSIGVMLQKIKRGFARQWQEMLAVFRFGTKDAATQRERTDIPVLCLTVWTGENAANRRTVYIREESFTIGNAEGFYLSLDPSYEVGDIYCSVFYDNRRHAYVFVQPTGEFLLLPDTNKKVYRPGDYSIAAGESRFDPVAADAVLVRDEPVYFNIAQTFRFKAFITESAAEKETKQLAVAAIQGGDTDAEQ